MNAADALSQIHNLPRGEFNPANPAALCLYSALTRVAPEHIGAAAIAAVGKALGLSDPEEAGDLGPEEVTQDVIAKAITLL